jgi:hypothetical protein
MACNRVINNDDTQIAIPSQYIFEENVLKTRNANPHGFDALAKGGKVRSGKQPSTALMKTRSLRPEF